MPTTVAAYAVREIVADMVELHDALGARPAMWVGHDWGNIVCDTVRSHLADPMRADCENLAEVIVEGRHELTLERPAEANGALADWLSAQRLTA